MNYNTEREAITMREYGRNLQRYVEFAKKLPTQEQRQKAAEAIVNMMGILNPQSKFEQDYKQKLWGQLIQIADFELDVKPPCDVPMTPQEAHIRPAVLHYPKSNIRMKHYGKNVESLIQKAIEIEDPQQEDELVQIIANFMKLSYKNWSHEEVNNNLIRQDLRTLSNGNLEISDDMHIEITVSTNTPGKNNFRKKGASGKSRNNTSYPRNNNRNKNKRFR